MNLNLKKVLSPFCKGGRGICSFPPLVNGSPLWERGVRGDLGVRGIFIAILFFCLCAILMPAYGEKKGSVTASAPVKYEYQGYKNRNPFYRSGSESASEYQETQGVPDISNFCLTGIMTDISGVKYAILSDSTGGSYILKNGWLYDAEGERVPSITGTVFEERVIVISGTLIKELKLPEVEPMIKLE